ncbi:tetratricopeptide repeat protein [Nocardiopsis sp. N85]|uniref:tetratricopeptide repeat protein n=1 Tax=Nocardiopsis sp. N85 TaxID=3029400 RepID=UPI00237F000A|nr:tetratricopeptide repeat protein [Nocardiopsis sp. N85]MDE3721417.1 tetratricopeptide repeat protein [Nocardiopsis sp. N85]
MVEGAHARGRPAVVVLTGPAGVGKTALATHLLHTHEHWGRDGAFFVDLRGLSTPPTDPHEALGSLLHTVGIDRANLPADTATRAAWWRSATASTTITVLADNALTAAQVRPLLPAGPQTTLVVTSRSPLAGLRLHGARTIEVPPLNDTEGARLLTALAPAPSPGSDTAVLRRISALCSGLPVALTTLALGHGTHHRARTWNQVEHHLTTARLAHLDATGRHLDMDTTVSAAFDLSYTALPAETARLYRRLGWHPGPDITTDTAAPLTGRSAPECAQGLDTLARHHLLVRNGERYTFHDLIRLHAAHRADQDETPTEQNAALARLTASFAAQAGAADALIRPYAGTVPTGAEVGFTDTAHALGWLETEHANLTAIAIIATDLNRTHDALHLLHGLWCLFLHHSRTTPWMNAVTPAIAAAHHRGDDHTRAVLLNNRALLHSHLGDTPAAMADLDTAQTLWTLLDDQVRLAQTLQRKGSVAFRAHLYDQAIDHLTHAVTVDETTGVTHNRAISHFMLGRAHHALNAHRRAVDHLTLALDLLEDDRYNRARIRTVLGGALTDLGEYDRAEQTLQEALAGMGEHGSASGQGKAWEALGDLARHQGEQARAQDAYRKAHELLPPTDPAHQRVSDHLHPPRPQRE